MSKTTWRARLSYAFDNSLSRGPSALMGWLGLASLVVIVVISLLVWATGIAPEYGLIELFWMSLMRTLDPGTMGGDSGTWPFLLSMFGVTLGGIFIISMLIGVLTTSIEERLQDLRKGRSRVVESGHTVILGWSEQIHTIVAQLSLANANQRRACIVILADRDKVAMEDELRDQVGSTGRTRLVCRSGNPMDMGDLEITNLHAARSIIVLAPDAEDGDSSVIKTMLAITNNPRRRPEPYHVVSELRDPRNMDVARLVGGDEVELVLIGDLIARIIAQTCRQSGLSAVYNELFDFCGNEIYVQSVPALTGRTFGEALLGLEGSSLLGIAPRTVLSPDPFVAWGFGLGAVALILSLIPPVWWMFGLVLGATAARVGWTAWVRSTGLYSGTRARALAVLVLAGVALAIGLVAAVRFFAAMSQVTIG